MIAANSASSSSYDVRISALIVRIHRPDLPAHVDAAAVGQPPVEHGHVGPQRRDAVSRLHRRTGLADHLDVALALQHVPQAAADDLVVVEQKDPDHSTFLPVHRRFASRDLNRATHAPAVFARRSASAPSAIPRSIRRIMAKSPNPVDLDSRLPDATEGDIESRCPTARCCSFDDRPGAAVVHRVRNIGHLRETQRGGFHALQNPIRGRPRKRSMLDFVVPHWP